MQLEPYETETGTALLEERPDWVKCIRHPRSDMEETICGRRIIAEWVFEGIDHWWLTRKNEDRLIGCADCVREIQAVVEEFRGPA